MNKIEEYTDWYTTNYVGLAGFTALVWDHMLTFSSEVELVWKPIRNGEWKPLLILFLITVTPEHRYLRGKESLFDTCRIHLKSLRLSFTHIELRHIVAMMMFIRIFALYHHNRRGVIIYGVAFLLLVQIAVNAWLLTLGEAVPHQYGVEACTMIFTNVGSGIASSAAWIPLIYDTVVLLLTVYKTLPGLFRKTGKVPGTFEIMRRMLEDGLLYYRQCHRRHNMRAGSNDECGATWIKECLPSVMMMSRITLSLRKSAQKRRTKEDDHVSTLVCASPVSPNSPNPPNRHTLDDVDPSFRRPDPVLNPKDPEAGSVMHIENASNRDDYLMVPTPGVGPSSTKIPASYLPPFTGHKSLVVKLTDGSGKLELQMTFKCPIRFREVSVSSQQEGWRNCNGINFGHHVAP
ncbi:hypothetical protein K435DRAFT_846182 [Dendrothele bispora CBS 962.96]|uniref:DUF6533 domain-containing protein n=1 Tax=Dendrothele bispora (strain CBS 962.96) TaxID=1314807 RepID=A0A4V4HAZ8_DENBC|nr:hypothetical protein K435DRAFT_846182 [Dendrothele bispora CBS 962.96]